MTFRCDACGETDDCKPVCCAACGEDICDSCGEWSTDDDGKNGAWFCEACMKAWG